MKLRLRANSIRLRLTQPEVAALAAGRSVTDSTDFGDGALLTTRVEADERTANISAHFASPRIHVRIPLAAARQWGSGDTIGLEHTQPLAGGGALRILLEKDFECLSPRLGESQSGTFPNPRAESCHQPNSA